MTGALLDPAYHALLPTPLAAAASTLASEMAANGEHTTADELVACIDALFGLLGRFWVAEYLTAGAPDVRVNRLLHDKVIARNGPVLGGAWIGIAREIRGVFEARDLPTVADGLRALDFGAPGHTDHPVSRLSAYRNSFAHGSFHAVVDDIRTHRSALESVLDRLPCLVKQPVVVDDGNGVLALRGDPERVRHVPVALPKGHPCIVSADGRVADLYPLAVLRDVDGKVGLAWPGKKGPGARELLRDARFQVWFERYQRELEGHVEGAERCLGGAGGWHEANAALRRATQDRTRGLVLLETAPGAPRTGVLADWGANGADLRWRVRPDTLMASGRVLSRALLRATERRLGLQDGELACADETQWREALADAARRLDQREEVLRLAVEDLHLGDEPANPGEPSVQHVWRALAGGPFLAVGGAVRQWSLRPLPWDTRVSLGWAPSDAGAPFSPELPELLAHRASTLHRSVLEVLLESNGTPQDLFAVCDALEAAGGEGTVVFEPEVERALWDLAPILTLGREARENDGTTEQVRTFTLLDMDMTRAALETIL